MRRTTASNGFSPFRREDSVRNRRRGFVLIFALWVLGFLTVLAVNVAFGVRQKIILVRKMDERSRMHYLLEAAAAQTGAYIRQQMAQAQSTYTLGSKMGLHNDPAVFADIALKEDHAQVGYTLYDEGATAARFGVVDEERKLNINTANAWMLGRLLERVLGMRSDDAGLLAQSILDWRKIGTSEASGFFSDDYYSNLQYPYPKKNTDYEIPDELLLVKGVTKDIYEKLLPYVTIYGDGKVNINTTPAPVLYALGLEDALIDKIMAVRRGLDGMDATADDHVFFKTFDVAAEVNAVVKLDPSEARAIDALNLQGLLTVNSGHFTMDIRGHLARTAWARNARAVYACGQNKILYWSEK